MQVRPSPPWPLGASARWAAGTSEFLGGPNEMPNEMPSEMRSDTPSDAPGAPSEIPSEIPSDVPTSTPRQAVATSLRSAVISCLTCLARQASGPISGVIPLPQ